MKPPYKISNKALLLISTISKSIGEIEGRLLKSPEPQLRKQNKIKTIQATLEIEGNTLSLEQVTAVLDGKRVLGPEKEILEVKNANELYELIDSLEWHSINDLFRAHDSLMQNLVNSAGSFRSKNVGVLKGSKVSHIAPKPNFVPELVQNLFSWAESSDLHDLVKSCIVHYELEFIHPFEDGNGRMGRFWQSLILYNYNSLFRFIPVESLIKENQKSYYEVLELCDKAGESTLFIEFMLGIIDECLLEYVNQFTSMTMTSGERLNYSRDYFDNKLFTRKEYLGLFKNISSATASRDLKEGVELKSLITTGSGNQTKYSFN
jgi:Fic family protein